MKAIDVSSAPPPSDQQIACLKAQGVVKAIVGTSYTYGGSPAQRIAAYKKGGLAVAEYQFPTDIKQPITDEVWLDVETPPGCTIAQIRAALNNIPIRGIYSSATMWTGTVGSYNVKAEHPWLECWDATYGALPRPWVPFGGFTEADRVMVQYAGNVSLCGLSVDLSEILQEDGMTPEEKAAFDAVTKAVFDQGARLGEAEATIKSLQEIAVDHALRIQELEAKCGDK